MRCGLTQPTTRGEISELPAEMPPIGDFAQDHDRAFDRLGARTIVRFLLFHQAFIPIPFRHDDHWRPPKQADCSSTSRNARIGLGRPKGLPSRRTRGGTMIEPWERDWSRLTEWPALPAVEPTI